MTKDHPLIVVDPGHGGKDPGAVSASGVRESDINLALARAFAAVSKEAPYETLILRTADVYMSLEDRARLANEAGAAAVLSFHANAAEDPFAYGYELWTSPGQTAADFLATAIFNRLFAAMLTYGRNDYSDGDPDKEARFYMLRRTAAPAVLIEFGFVTHPQDLAGLTDLRKQAQLARAVRGGVEEWLEMMGQV